MADAPPSPSLLVAAHALMRGGHDTYALHCLDDAAARPDQCGPAQRAMALLRAGAPAEALAVLDAALAPAAEAPAA